MIIIEDMEKVEVIRRGDFPGRTSNIFRQNDSRKRNREDRSWRQSRSRERGMRARSESSSRSSSRTNTNGDGVQCFKCRECDHFVNECPKLLHDESDRESDGATTLLQLLADSDTGSEVEQYLNI